MPLSNIPRTELLALLAQYKALPFSNGTAAGVSVTITVDVQANINISNGDNDDVLSVSEAVDVPFDSVTNQVRANKSVKRMIADVQQKSENLIQKVRALSRAYSVPTSEIWRYLSVS
jgi:hypothetical protein